MFERLFGNWKTTVAGFVVAFGQYLYIRGEGGFTWETFFAVLPAILIGLLSKD